MADRFAVARRGPSFNIIFFFARTVIHVVFYKVYTQRVHV